MRWSIEELFETYAMLFHREGWKFFKRIPTAVEETFRWLFKGHCSLSIWNLDYFLTKVLSFRLQKFIDFGYTDEGHEWDNNGNELPYKKAEKLKHELTIAIDSLERYNANRMNDMDEYNKIMRDMRRALDIIVTNYGHYWD